MCSLRKSISQPSQIISLMLIHWTSGAYAIQTFSDLIIEGFEGSYSNVVGLPVEMLEKVLSTII